MKEVTCPVKNIKVYISREYINASSLDDKGSGAKALGRYNCSDNDCYCDYDRCPMEKMKNS